MEMKCPRCKSDMIWNSDWECDVTGCECGDGIVSSFVCQYCNVTVEVIMDCKGTNEEEEE